MKALGLEKADVTVEESIDELMKLVGDHNGAHL